MIEILTLGGILAAGTLSVWLFWSVAVVFLFLEIVFNNLRMNAWAGVLLLVMVAVGAGLYGFVAAFHLFWQHPMIVVEYLGGYIAAAIVLGCLQWYRRCRRISRLLRASRLQYLAEAVRPILPVPNWDPDGEWHRLLKRDGLYVGKSNPYSDPGRLIRTTDMPDWREHKDDILSWSVFWPFSLLNMVFGDWLYEMAVAVRDSLGRLYAALARLAWRDMESLRPSEPYKPSEPSEPSEPARKNAAQGQ